MDRPTSRHGRHGVTDRSLSVADLVAKSTPAERASVSAIQAKAAEEAWARVAMPPLNAPDGTPGEEQRSSGRLIKTIAGTMLAMLAIGAVTAVATLTDERRGPAAPSTPTVQPVLAGPAAVRPAVIEAQLSGQPLPIGAGLTDPDAELSPDDEHGQIEPPPPAATGQRPPDQPPKDDYVFDTIEEFYTKAVVPSQQAEAFALLGPAMQGDETVKEFQQAWADLTRYPGENKAPNIQRFWRGRAGTARLVVTMGNPSDGTALRIEQIMMVSDGPKPRIERARVLSVHRL